MLFHVIQKLLGSGTNLDVLLVENPHSLEKILFPHDVIHELKEKHLFGIGKIGEALRVILDDGNFLAFGVAYTLLNESFPEAIKTVLEGILCVVDAFPDQRLEEHGQAFRFKPGR